MIPVPDGGASVGVVVRLLTAVWGRVQSSSRKLAKATTKAVPGPLRKRTLAKWLRTQSATDVLSPHNTKDIGAVAEQLRMLLSAQNRRGNILPDQQRAEYIDDVARYLRDNYLRHFDPSESMAIADSRAESRHVEQLRRSSPPDEARLAELPPQAASGIRALHLTHPSEAHTLTEELSIDDPHFAISKLLDNEPPWLANSPARIWASLGDFAWSHYLTPEADRCYARSLSRGGEDQYRSVLARQVLSQQRDRAGEILDEAGDIDVPLLQAVRLIAVEQNHRAGLDILSGLHIPSRERASSVVDSLTLISLVNIGRYEEAVSKAKGIIDSSPDIAVGYAGLAQAAGMAGDRQRAGSSQQRDYYDIAFEAATTALKRTARWSGPEGHLRHTAARLAVVRLDHDAVFQLTAGTDDRELLLFRTKSHIDRAEFTEAAEACSSAVDDEFLSQLKDGLEAIERMASREDIAEIFHTAFDLASMDIEQQIAIVMAGRYGGGLPDLTSYGQESPVSAAMFQAMQALTEGRHQHAAELVNPYVNESVTAAELLARSHFLVGRPEDAVDVLVEAAERFGALSLIAEAADYLWTKERFQESEDLLAKGLTIPNADADEELLLRQRHVQAALSRNDFETAILRAEQSLDAHPADTTTAWFLVEILGTRNRWSEAAAALRRFELEAETDEQARISILVRSRADDPSDSVRYALDMADRFPSSLSVMTVAYHTVALGRGDVEISDADYRRVRQLVDSFPERFPGQILVFDIDPEDPLAVFDLIREEVGDLPDLPSEILSGVLRGVLPVGVLATIRSKPDAEIAALAGSAGWPIVSVNPNFAAHEQEVRDAKVHGTGKVVVDVSLAITASQIDDHPLELVSHLLIPQDTMVGIDSAFNGHGEDRDSGWRFSASHGPLDYGVLLSEARDRLAEAEELLKRRATRVNTRSHKRPPEFSGGDTEHDDVDLGWMEPIVAAAMTDAPLFSDDAGLRSIARSMGVTAFGTYAVIDSRYREGLISAETFEVFTDLLASSFHVDLPFSADQVLRLAGRNEKAALAILSRPRVWGENNRAVTRLFIDRLDWAANRGDEDSIREWSYYAALGILRGLAEPHSVEILGRLFHIGACRPGYEIHALGNAVLDGFEAACQTESIQDCNRILETAAKVMVDVASDRDLADLVDPGLLVKAMFSPLTEVRQQVVRRAVLLES